MKKLFSILIIFLLCSASYEQKSRARDFGVPINDVTGEYKFITNVKGVDVGYSTIIS